MHMIDLHCPSCGAGGRAPKEKINTSLVCKRCHKTFHITPVGKVVAGEASASHPTVPHHAEHEPDEAEKVDEWFSEIREIVTSPRTYITTIAVLVGLIATWRYFSYTPSSLEEQVSSFSQAALEGDLKTVRQMAASGMNEEIVRWYDAVRPRCDLLRRSLGTLPLSVRVDVKKRDDANGTAEVVAHLASSEDLQRTGGTMPDPIQALTSSTRMSLDLLMQWKLEGRSGWKMDAVHSLVLAPTVP